MVNPRNINLLCAILTCALCSASCAAAASASLRLEGLEIEDGDTLVAELDGKRERLQLAGIDAPEDSDNPKLQRDLQRTGLERERLLALGRAASEHLRRITGDTGPFVVTYDTDKRDRYGRLSVELSDRDGFSLNLRMVADGYARVLDPSTAGGELPQHLVDFEGEAIRQGRGLWGSHPEAARAWRGETPK